MAVIKRQFSKAEITRVLAEIVQFAKDKDWIVVLHDCDGLVKKFTGFKIDGKTVRLAYASLCEEEVSPYTIHIEAAVFTRIQSNIASVFSGLDIDGEIFRIEAVPAYTVTVFGNALAETQDD